MNTLVETPILQDRASTGKPKFWQGVVLTDGTHFYTASRFWQAGSAPQESAPTLVTGKNIGRANETSPEAQARAEVASAQAKKEKKGYVVQGAAPTRVLPMPMLAHSFEKRGHNITFPCDLQPKLDGCRAVTDGERFWSREGNLFPDASIAHLKFDAKGVIYDGELMLPQNEFTFEETIHAVKSFDPAMSPQLEYHIFDVVDTVLPWRERERLVEGFPRTKHTPPKVRSVQRRRVVGRADIETIMGEFVEQGYEGVIIRNLDGVYKLKHRSADLQKWKPFVDDEFRITDVLEGAGKDAGTAILVCVTEAGTPFKARPKGKLAWRQRLWNERGSLVGKRVTVTYQNLTSDGVPRFPVAKAIRDYE